WIASRRPCGATSRSLQARRSSASHPSPRAIRSSSCSRRGRPKDIRAVPTERVRRAVAYLEGGNADVASLHEMGLTAADVDEVLGLVACGDKASREVKDARERLHETRVTEEEGAGLAPCLGGVKEP